VATPHPQLWIPCPACLGEEAKCDRCNGSGREAVHRCPLAIADPSAQEACTACAFMESGILPAAGGLYDQAALFVEALSVIGAGRRFIEQEREAREREEEARRGDR
jgi:hypothetical protein